jgi:hypothetical protein
MTAAIRRANKGSRNKKVFANDTGELATIGRKRFKGRDWEIVDDVYAVIHDRVALDPELAAKTDPPHLYRRFHVATFWCDHVARCAGTQKISMEFASSELAINGARRIKRSLNPVLNSHARIIRWSRIGASS